MEKNMSNSLDAFSKALDTAAMLREQDRIHHNEQLGEPLLFIPTLPEEEELVGFGIGWFKQGEYFVAYPRYSNGYALTPCASIGIEQVKQLATLVFKES